MPGVHFRAMLQRTLLVIALLAALGAAQAPTGANPADGFVLNGAYKNNYFGFSYTIPAGFSDRTKDVPALQGASRTLLYVSEPKQATTVARSVAVFADDAAESKAKDGAQYLDHFAGQMHGKVDLVGKMTSFTVGMHTFYRQDFRPHASFPVRQTVVATVMKGYALSFVLTAADVDGTNGLLTGVEAIKFLPHH
jgi:hypothetical protein